MASIFSGDVGVVLRFPVLENGAPADLSGAQQIELLVDGKVFLCTIPATPTDVPTYTTTGNENLTPGTLPAQLKITRNASNVFHTSFFEIFVLAPNAG